MKKLFSLVLAVVLAAAVLSFAGCNKEETPDNSEAGNTVSDSKDSETDNIDEQPVELPEIEEGNLIDESETLEGDLKYVKDKGTLVVGITDFAPMDYQKDGKWIGFDADMATAFAKGLGVEVEFVEIEWNNKVLELEGKSIDCVWNGMTLDDQVMAAMSTSKPYCNNAQVVIVPAADAEKYKTADDCKDLNFAVEAGSAGKKMAEANGFSFTEVDKQATALMEVKSGTSDAAIIDSLMAGAMVGEATGYSDLTYTVRLNSEEYGVGFRKDSNITEKLNKFLDESMNNGTTEAIAKVYGVQAALIK